MATFQELRDYLTSNYANLAHMLGPDEQPRFQNSFARLQNSWDSIAAEQVKYQETMQEMRKYPAVWEKLEDEDLTTQQSSFSASSFPAPTTAQPQFSAPATVSAPSFNPPPFASPGRQAPAAVQAAQYTRATEEPINMSSNQMSQQAIDRTTLWERRTIMNKEIFTYSMGGLIVLATVIISFVAVLSIGNANSFAAAKDVLLVMDGLVGVVLGYYFGRTPADVRADRAEHDVHQANSERDRLMASVSTILDGSTVISDSRGGVDGLQLNAKQVEQLRYLLRQR